MPRPMNPVVHGAAVADVLAAFEAATGGTRP